MSVRIQLVGGPYDGKVVEIPDRRPHWYMPDLPSAVNSFRAHAARPERPMNPLCYERVGNRLGHDSQGACEIYRLVA